MELNTGTNLERRRSTVMVGTFVDVIVGQPYVSTCSVPSITYRMTVRVDGKQVICGLQR